LDLLLFNIVHPLRLNVIVYVVATESRENVKYPSKRHSTIPIDHLTFENIHWIDSMNPGHL